MALGSRYGAGEVAGVRGVLGVEKRLETEERVESLEESSDSLSAGLGHGKNLPVVEQSGYRGCASVWFARWGWYRFRKQRGKKRWFNGFCCWFACFWCRTALLSPDGDMRISVWSARVSGNGGRW
jgi:hypothetical protein